MKNLFKTVGAALAALSAAASLLAVPQIRTSPDGDAPTFSFTRLVYTENPRGGRRNRGGTMAKPEVQFRCPEFGGGRFFPIQGWGWATDYPGGDCKFMGAIHRLTGIRVDPDPNVMEILNKDLFKFPFVYAVEVGGMYVNAEEAARLREFLLRGGFMHVDDFWGPDQFANFEEQMLKVFPDREITRLSLDHPVFHSFFDLDTVMQIPNQNNGCRDDGRTWQDERDRNPAVFGISDDDGRLMVLITYNSDLGDAWEYMDLPCYPVKFSGQAYRMGLNFMIYAMTH